MHSGYRGLSQKSSRASQQITKRNGSFAYHSVARPYLRYDWYSPQCSWGAIAIAVFEACDTLLEQSTIGIHDSIHPERRTTQLLLDFCKNHMTTPQVAFECQFADPRVLIPLGLSIMFWLVGRWSTSDRCPTIDPAPVFWLFHFDSHYRRLQTRIYLKQSSIRRLYMNSYSLCFIVTDCKKTRSRIACWDGNWIYFNSAKFDLTGLDYGVFTFPQSRVQAMPMLPIRLRKFSRWNTTNPRHGQR